MTRSIRKNLSLNIMKSFISLLLLAYNINANEFPNTFKFGVATASYQVEGAWNTSGKGANIWDWITHTYPTFTSDQNNGDVACDSYHKVEEDIKLLKDLNMDFYRFSISWARIFPTGQINNINPDGIRYYNELIDGLLANGIAPVVTMYHWDLPLALHEIGGWPNIALADIFADYADQLFALFGDRVKDWITFNELDQICEFGYSDGILAPGYTQLGVGGYLCGHTLLIAHAKAYRLYERKYKFVQQGSIGISVQAVWFTAAAEGPEYEQAAETSHQFTFGRWVHPIYHGDYPPIMREKINALSAAEGYPRSRLPYFTAEEIELIKGTADFLGVNYYTSFLCLPLGQGVPMNPLLNEDSGVTCYQPTSWPTSASSWLRYTPWGFPLMLNRIKEEYGNPMMMITENGYSDTTGEIYDCARVNYFNNYLSELLTSIIRDGTNVFAYTAWTLMDNFEWISGYTQKFGLYHVNFTDPDRTRTPKMSAHVLRNIIRTREIDPAFTPIGFEACPVQTD